MGLNKQRGNMYPFVTHTYNTVKGKCPHNCSYCYMKRFPQKNTRFDESELKTNLGSRNTIFVGSSCDMWAWDIPQECIEKTLAHCKYYYRNKYLFQSKNPQRFTKFYGQFPKNTILGTTIETNRYKVAEKYSEAPSTFERYMSISDICKEDGCPVMVSIEPIMDFDLKKFLGWFYDIEPEFVSIGADSKNHNLPEPNIDKINDLISELRTFTEVKVKPNLKRLTIGG